MIATPFAFCAPTNLEDVLELLAGNDAGTKVLAGGMSMVPAMNLGILRPAKVVSLGQVGTLVGVVEDGDTMRVGAMTSHKRVASDPLVRRYLPLLAEAASVIGDVQVRNRGTIGGSIAHADAAANYLAVMMAVGARLKVKSASRERTVPIEEFLLGIFATCLDPSELVTEVILPKLSEQVASSYVQLVRIKGGFPIVTAAAVIGREAPRLAIGGVLPKPVLIPLPTRCEDMGRSELEEIEAVAREMCSDALSDASIPGEYRRAMAGTYARRAVERALEDAINREQMR